MGINGGMLMSKNTLRDYQKDVYNKAREALKMGYKSPLIVLPCRSRQKLYNERNYRIC